MNGIQILIVDYGSQYTLVIGRTLRELRMRSLILPPKKAGEWLKNNNPKAVILSGSNWSVHNEGAGKIPKSLDITGKKYVILGICYGMQLLAHKLGGTVARPHDHREYGPAEVKPNVKHPLFYGVKEKTEVKPTDLFILDQDKSVRELKLVTCTPEGTTLRRGVVTAVLDEN